MALACASSAEIKKGQKNPMFGKTGENTPFFGKTHSEESRIRNTRSQPSRIKIEVTDIETNTTATYDSINQAAEALGLERSGLSKRLKKTNSFIFKGRYQVLRI